MATWGVHFRMAEAILNTNKYELDTVNFLVGNIGPDCGKPNEDWSEFTPPTEVSHWIDGERNIRADRFFEKYLCKEIDDNKEWSFLVGYYVHLLTDIEWRKMVKLLSETNDDYAKLKTDKKFIWTIKEDWYDLDHLYFRDNPNSIFWNIFQHIDEFPNYLEYYPEGAITRQIKYITEYYNNPSENLDREYKYLSMDDMNTFLDKTLELILSDLQKKLNLKLISNMN